MDFDSRVVVVTGSGRGIGRSVAQMFAKHGATVVLAGKEDAPGREVEQAILAAGGRCLFVKTDVSRPDEIASLMLRVEGEFGGVDILINNAGISRFGNVMELPVEEWDEIMNTNLRAAFLCSREAARSMKHRGGGAIVNIASTRAVMSEPHSEAYAASKGGLVALTHALALSLGPEVCVNCISPGWIATKDYDVLRPEDHAQHPAGRVGKPEDIARACLFLSSGENRFITGANFIIDGGMTRKMIYVED